jgi:hypothetical protein
LILVTGLTATTEWQVAPGSVTVSERRLVDHVRDGEDQARSGRSPSGVLPSWYLYSAVKLTVALDMDRGPEWHRHGIKTLETGGPYGWTMQVVAVVSPSRAGQIAQILTAEGLAVEYTSPTEERGAAEVLETVRVVFEVIGATEVIRSAIEKVREQLPGIEIQAGDAPIHAEPVPTTVMQPPRQLPPPGWHDDPNDPTSLRYWDGTQWTENRAPRVAAVSVSPGSAAATSWPPLRLAALGGAAAIIIGSFSPWATVSTVFGSISVSGTDDGGDGLFSLVGGVVVVLLVLLSKYLGSLIVSALTGALLLYDLINVNRNISDVDTEFARASVGWGLWLATAGAIVAFGTSWVLRQTESSASKPAVPSQP